MLSFQTQQKGLEMLLNVSADLPRFMWTDAVRLKQILVNLLGNAVKFTDRGEVELKIYPLATMPHGMTSICFEVRDTGIGIRPDKQQKIFEAFSQEDVSTTKRYGGTGLGLTISNKLLALMGSQLRLKSIPGTGSTFYFELTVRTEDGPPIVWENFDQIKNVLIVDDNKNNRMIVKNMLQLKNIQADEARNGVDAMQQLLSGQRYDVILMDYHMPYMDGLETIQKIREHEKGLHKDGAIVLLHSSSDDEKIIKASEDLQVNARLIKPIKLQEMHDTLAHIFIKDRDDKPIVPKKEEQPLRADLHVLIAEDNPINMLLATTIVKKIVPTAVVTEANNGKEAIEMCKRILPDIIFMDIQMPEVNGYEATQEIRKLTPDIRIPIIALTAGNVKGEKEKCMAAGMDDFVTKPFVEDNIVTVMNQWLPAVEL
jgi:CheY-like chemotaxis protein